jgi:SAM-dependent methyltransferase
MAEAEALLGGPLAPGPRTGAAPIGPTASVAIAEEAGWAYPVLDGVPILMVPERLYPNGAGPASDVTQPPYAEAYREAIRYTELIEASHANPIAAEAARLRELQAIVAAGGPRYPALGVWLSGTDEIGAQRRAINHLAPVKGARALQIGGIGSHVLAMVAAGAKVGMLVSPVPAEVQWFRAVADEAGLADRVAFACALAEELPLGDASVDRVYSPSSIHHTDTSRSFPEIARVLAPGGRFASVDVYRSPLYGVGIRLFGKRERGVACKPLDGERLRPSSALPGAELTFHGSLFRYPLAVVARRGRRPSLRTSVRLAAAEDAIARRMPGVSRLSSLVCVTAARPS